MTLRAKLSHARQSVKEISVRDALACIGDESVVFLDVRDTCELQQHGVLPGAVHLPRGSLEFAIDPLSPSHREDLRPGSDKTIIVFCASGLRSLLAAETMQEMGLKDVFSVKGGFTAMAQELDKISPT